MNSKNHQSTRALATFAAHLDPARLPDEVRRKLGWLLLDHLRVCSIGARLPWSGWARDYASVVAKAGASHVLFAPDTLNPQHATFLNVAFGSSFDADDTHVGAMLHPGIAAWSAALATAEHVGVSGPEVLAAVVAGYEVAIRVGLSVQPGHFQRGFQSTGTCDVFGTAAAAGRLLFGGADERILAAVGLAGSYSSGVAQFYYSGASGKRIQAAHAAQSGVAAALLTQHGFAGPADMIEGSGGFARAYADGFNPAIIEDGLGATFLLMDVLVKSHAAAARVAAGIDAMLALRQQHGFSGDDIASMHLGIPKVIQGRLTNPHPVDLQVAQMCLPFSVALASHLPLAAGRIPTLAVADYEAGLGDRRLFEIEDRTTIALDDEVEAASNALSTAAKVSVRLRNGRIPTLAVADYEAGLGDRRLFEIEDRTTIALDDEVEAASNALSTAAKVSVRLRDGREFTKFVPAPKGSAGDPFTAQEHEARFVQELSSRATDKVCADIVAMSKDLDRLDPRWLGQVLSGAK